MTRSGTCSKAPSRSGSDAGTRIEFFVQRVVGLGPEATLRRGYAIVRDPAGQPLGTRREAETKPILEVEFQDGRLRVENQAAAKELERRVMGISAKVFVAHSGRSSDRPWRVIGPLDVRSGDPGLPSRPTGPGAASNGPIWTFTANTTGLLSGRNAEVPENPVSGHYRILPTWPPKYRVSPQFLEPV